MKTALRVAAPLLLALASCGRGEREPEVAGLLDQLRSTEPRTSGRARLELITLGQPAVPALAAMLRSDDPRDQLLAATTLWGMGARARGAVPELAASLVAADPQLRLTAAMALESMGPEARDAVPALVRALADRDGRVRQAAVKALGAIGKDASAALPALEARLRRGHWPEAEEAVLRIRGGGPPPVSPDAPAEEP